MSSRIVFHGARGQIVLDRKDGAMQPFPFDQTIVAKETWLDNGLCRYDKVE